MWSPWPVTTLNDGGHCGPAPASSPWSSPAVTGWQTVSPWALAQKGQGSPSSDGGIYRGSYQQATAIVASLNTTAAPATSSSGGPTGVVVQAAAGLNCGLPVSAAAGGGDS